MKRLMSASLLCLALSACGTARLVSRDQYGGIFALEGDRAKAMEDAQSQMAQLCRGPYQIVSEGEQVVGTDTAGESKTYVNKRGQVVERGGQSTRDATEWRVQYQCTAEAPQLPPNGQLPPGPGSPPPPPPAPGQQPQPGYY